MCRGSEAYLLKDRKDGLQRYQRNVLCACVRVFGQSSEGCCSFFHVKAGLSHMLVMLINRHEDSLFSKINDVDITGQLALRKTGEKTREMPSTETARSS